MTPIEKAQAKLDELNYNFQSYDLDSFLAFINRFTERNISIDYVEILPSYLPGCWFTGGENDNRELILISNRAPKYIQEYTIFHELAHVLFRHKTASILELNFFISSLYSNQVLYRDPNNIAEENKPEEIEAETFAILVQQQLFKYGRKTDLSGIEKFIATFE